MAANHDDPETIFDCYPAADGRRRRMRITVDMSDPVDQPTIVIVGRTDGSGVFAGAQLNDDEVRNLTRALLAHPANRAKEGAPLHYLIGEVRK